MIKAAREVVEISAAVKNRHDNKCFIGDANRSCRFAGRVLLFGLLIIF
jgi:hypothetical protein